MRVTDLLIAVAAGFVVTVIATLLLPARWGHRRPLAAAALGVLTAYLVWTLIPLTQS
jgi:hypothetical protein